MSSRRVHLVGSVPLANASEVFREVAGILGPALRSIPDGETGERLNWMGWLEPVFASHPSFESTGERFSPRAGGKEVTGKYRLKANVSAEQVRFENLPQSEVALRSYEEFSRQKKAGTIPANVRFQVTFAGPLSVVRRFVAEESEQAALQPAYERALYEEIKKIADVVPHHELAVQWDVASAIFETLERNVPTRHGSTRQEMLNTFVPWHIRMGMAVPADVHLMFHLCYGDASHKHSIEPASMELLVQFANRISAGIARTIELVHMPVPRDRIDDAYFEPLTRLNLHPETKLALGLVHYSDGTEGTRKRMAVAQKYVQDFAIGTECGFGRRDPGTIAALLEVHAHAAGLN